MMAKKITAFLMSFVTAVLFLLSLVIIILGIVSARNNKIISLFGYSFAAVATDSMAPTIEPQSIVIAKKVNFIDAEKGDIIIYYSETYKVYLVHRVVEVTPAGNLRTKGDNPLAAIDEDQVTEKNFYGKVVKYGRFFGLGKLLLNNRYFTYLIIVVALLLTIVIESVSIVKSIIAKNKPDLSKKT
ncbi:MAG: signal peptidase I [Bacilli bacterium]|nr:signal peptidase I [Bacilli bacterium]